MRVSDTYHSSTPFTGLISLCLTCVCLSCFNHYSTTLIPKGSCAVNKNRMQWFTIPCWPKFNHGIYMSPRSAQIFSWRQFWTAGRLVLYPDFFYYKASLLNVAWPCLIGISSDIPGWQHMLIQNLYVALIGLSQMYKLPQLWTSPSQMLANWTLWW